MEALDEYFLIVVFTLLLNGVHVFVDFMLNLGRESWHSVAFWDAKTKNKKAAQNPPNHQEE